VIHPHVGRLGEILVGALPDVGGGRRAWNVRRRQGQSFTTGSQRGNASPDIRKIARVRQFVSRRRGRKPVFLPESAATLRYRQRKSVATMCRDAAAELV
jgi:hypothetical protein